MEREIYTERKDPANLFSMFSSQIRQKHSGENQSQFEAFEQPFNKQAWEDVKKAVTSARTAVRILPINEKKNAPHDIIKLESVTKEINEKLKKYKKKKTRLK